MRIGKLEIRFQTPIIISIEKSWMREVKQSLREGKTLMAIKIYKDNTGKGLRESKDYVVDVLKPKYFVEFKETKNFREEVANEIARFQAEQMHKLRQ